MTTPTSAPTELPDLIGRYLTAHVACDVDTAMDAFGPDAVVVDDGQTYCGTDEVRAFLAHAGAEFTYTTEILGSERLDDGRWLVRVHIEGDFPGGVADLGYRFTTAGDHITELDITA